MTSRTALATLLLAIGLVRSRAVTAQAPAYPPSPRDSTVDDYHGVRVADPYRWLEQLDEPATHAWVEAQSRVTLEYLRNIPGRDAIRRRLVALSSFRRTEVPWREAGQVFFLENAGTQHQPVLYLWRAPGDTPQVVLDPQQISPDGAIAVRNFVVSPDGRRLAYSVSAGGADAGETHVRDLSSGHDLDDVVSGPWGSVCWTFDARGFFYVRPPAPHPGDPPDAPRIEKQLWYHRLGRPQSQDRLLYEWKENYRWAYCMLSDDGRRLIAVAERGAIGWLYVMDLKRPGNPDLSAPLELLLAGRESGIIPLGTAGDTLYLVTDREAPRRQVISLDLSQGASARPRTVVPEGPEVIQGATVAGDRLALHYMVDVTSRLRLFTLQGRPAGEVPLPGIGAVGWALNGRFSAPELYFSFESFLSPSTAYRYDVRRGRLAAIRPPKARFDPRRYRTSQVFYQSADGTRVPMFITAGRELKLDGRNPTLLTGYGGYGSVEGPTYDPATSLWLELGGVWAVPNIRGGGEYGEEWHRAGSLDHKQNSFDDFIAAAEYLVAGGYTSPRKLAIYGHSNGGLLIGAVMTQRPDLFGAAIPDAGHYDMLRYHRFTVGVGWIPEYGSPDDSTAFRYLYAYSPLQHVRPGVCYPPTLLLAADHDDRVVPSHAYKFAATLQAAQACDRPILLRVASDASHGYTSEAGAIAQWADLFAFCAGALDFRAP